MSDNNASRSCRRCGAVLTERDRFCVQCGAPVQKAPIDQVPANPLGPPPKPLPPRRGWRPTGRTLVLALDSLAFAVVAGAWLLMGGAAPVTAGGRWVFSSNEDGIQAIYLKDDMAGSGSGLFRFVCDTDDGVVWMNSQALAGDEAEKRAATRHGLDLTLTGGGRSITVEGYTTLAPEGASSSYEAPRSEELLAILAAPDLAITAPSLSLRGAGTVVLGDFVRACPAVASLGAGDKQGWGTLTSRVAGYRLQIPRRLFRIVQGDRFGRLYESDIGHARLQVASQVNALEQTLDAAVRMGTIELPALDKKTYQAATKDWIAVSGLSGKSIVYFKARTTCDDANFVSFRLSYDEAARETFDPVAARISKSLDTNTLSDGSPLCP